METPPRAWRRLELASRAGCILGNTSTGVEKTIITISQPPPPEKHLHGRGEDGCGMSSGAVR